MYNRLFTKILDSSIWLEPDSTRIVWVTLLATMNEDGYCHFSDIRNLASRARVSVVKAQRAIKCFEAPDPSSENLTNEGRRIERVPGGYIVLNAGYYRTKFTREIEKEQTRIRVARFRAKRKVPIEKTVKSNDLTVTLPLHSVSPASVSESDWLKELSTDTAYIGIDVYREHAKAIRWYKEHNRQCTRRCFINWLNKSDRNLGNGTDQKHHTTGSRNIGTSNEGKSGQYAGVGKVK